MIGSKKRTIFYLHVSSEIGLGEHSGGQHGAKNSEKAQNLKHVEPFYDLQSTFCVNMRHENR